VINSLLDAALYHHEAGRPVIAVSKNKKAHHRCWDRYFTERQTEAEVREEFSNGVYGIAEVLYPASDNIHVDYDGPCAEEGMRKTGVELSETARIFTPSGFYHDIFKASSFLKKFTISRKVRLIKVACNCEKDGKPHPCGVDLLVNGYSVIPPTPGYREDPDHPLESAVEIPDALVKLAFEKHNTQSQKNSTDGDRFRDGERNVDLASLAGSMRRRGMSFKSIFAALKVENEEKCDPPLAEREVEAIAKSVSRYPSKKEEATAGRAGGEQKPWVMSMDKVTEEKTEWLWKPRIPRRRPTVFGGDPGSGKSFCSLKVVASVTRGEALPGDEKPEAPHNVLLISTEDGYSDVCKPRLRVLGADMSRIYIPEPERNLTPSLIMSGLEHLVKASDPKLVILDPLMAFAAGKSVEKASVMRQLLTPITNLAEKFDFALLIICHLNKSQVKSLYRIQESIDLVALARSVFIFANDADDKERHIIAHAKSSLGVKTTSLSFYIRDDGNAGRFEWGENVDIGVDELLSSDETKKLDNSQLVAAKRWLEQQLANGSTPSNTIKDSAEKAGIAWRTVWRAKDELNVKARKEKGTGEWRWRL